MNSIQLHDRFFEPYITGEEIATAILELAQRIDTDYKNEDVLFLSILNGSFMFTSDLMKKIKMKSEVSFIKVSSYLGTETSGRVDELIGLNSQIENRHIVILEDIVDTGITIDKVFKLLEIQNPSSIQVCSILFKKESYQGIHPPKYFGFEIPNRFVVGYGLDYNQLGRNLPEIYQVIENPESC